MEPVGRHTVHAHWIRRGARRSQVWWRQALYVAETFEICKHHRADFEAYLSRALQVAHREIIRGIPRSASVVQRTAERNSFPERFPLVLWFSGARKGHGEFLLGGVRRHHAG